MNNKIPEITVEDVKTIIFMHKMIGWHLSNTIHVNTGIVYIIYEIQKDLRRIKGNAYLLRKESLDIYNIIYMILEIRG